MVLNISFASVVRAREKTIINIKQQIALFVVLLRRAYKLIAMWQIRFGDLPLVLGEKTDKLITDP